ncbi:MAG: BON domain-containing protein [Acidimicrobiia bacterium]|nr:BON domain-containing protein [Acidimicrobiia bacterium]
MQTMTKVCSTVGRAVVLPLRAGVASIRLLVRLVLVVVAAPFVFGWRATRRAGAKAVTCFFLGLAVGLAVAPRRGAELRSAVLTRLMGATHPPDGELADRLRSELAHAPATWHLAQPSVTVDGGIATLTGTVAHAEAAAALTRTAAALPGIRDVVADLRVAPPDEGSE